LNTISSSLSGYPGKGVCCISTDLKYFIDEQRRKKEKKFHAIRKVGLKWKKLARSTVHRTTLV